MIEKFDKILKMLETNPVDFRIEKHIKLPEIFTKEVLNKLKPFGMNNAGCIFCYWINSNNITACPVVWIDSEGEPYAVFASGMVNFFELLAYGTGAIYDIIRASEKFYRNPEKYPSPEILFKNLFAENFTNEKGNKARITLKELLKSEMNISVVPDPGKQIYLNYKNFIDITNEINKNVK